MKWDFDTKDLDTAMTEDGSKFRNVVDAHKWPLVLSEVAQAVENQDTYLDELLEELKQIRNQIS